MYCDVDYKKIISKSNNLYKKIKSLTIKKHRKKEGLFLVEGWKSMLYASELGIYPRYIVARESLVKELNKEKQNYFNFESSTFENPCNKSEMNIELPDNLFEALSDVENSQGILGVYDISTINSGEEIQSNKKDFCSGGLVDVLVLDKVQDPGNLGTIVRACDAFGIKEVHMTKGCVDLFSAKSVRSTMGCIFNVKVIQDWEEEDLFEYLKNKNKKIYVSTPRAQKTLLESLEKRSESFDVALVVGNESKGVSKFWLDNADELIKVNMTGSAESLNVAMATSIILHTMQESRNN